MKRETLLELKQKLNDYITKVQFSYVFEIWKEDDAYDKGMYNKLNNEFIGGLDGINEIKFGERLKSLIEKEFNKKLKIEETEKPQFDNFDSKEIQEIKKLEPDALLIYIKDDYKIYFRPPDEDPIQYEISQEKFTQRITSILQRLVLDYKVKEDECEILGTSLLKRLFSNEEAKKKFCSWVKEKGKTKTKVILQFDEKSSSLACLPWEYLFLPADADEEKGCFLGALQELILTRRLSPLHSGIIQPTEMQVLNVLIAVSMHLSEKHGSDEKREEDQIKTEIELNNSGGKKVVCEKNYFSSFSEFTKYIEEKEIFHAVHFIGLNVKKSEVAFYAKQSSNENEIGWINHNNFITCFNKKKPTLIFLHATKEGDKNTYLGLTDLAFHLAKEIAGALVIQAPEGNLNAVEFSKLIYKELIGEEELDRAVKNSLTAMAKKDSNDNPNAKAYGITAIFSREALRLKFNKNQKESDIKIDYCQGQKKMRGKKSEKCNEEIKIIDGKPNMAICDRCQTLIEQCPNCKQLINPSWKIEGTCCRCGKTFIEKDSKVKSDGFTTSVPTLSGTIKPLQSKPKSIDVRITQNKN